MDATNYIKGELIGWIVNGETFDTPPTNIYVALHSDAPGDDAVDNELDSSDGASGYERYESVVPDDWTEPAIGDFENANDFVFEEALENWPEVTHFSLWDGPSETDNAIAQDSLLSSTTVTEGDGVVFRSGNLSGTFE